MTVHVQSILMPAKLDAGSIAALRAEFARATAAGAELGTLTATGTFRAVGPDGLSGVRGASVGLAGGDSAGLTGAAILLRGASRTTFCAGFDLAQLGDASEDTLRAGLRDYAHLLLAIAESPVPVIAIVEGDAFGGGVGIAAASDVVIATLTARFGLPEALHGFYPAIVFAALDLRLPIQRSRRLALQCESIDAAAAGAWGLADEVIGAESLGPVIHRWARRLARARPDAVAAIRLHAPHRARFRDALDAGVEATATALSRPEIRAAIAEGLA